MAKEQPKQEGVEESGGKKSSKMMLIIVAAVLLLSGGGAAAWFLMGSDEALAEGEGAAAEETVVVSQEAPAKQALYQELHPAFVVNFPAGKGARLMQLKLEVMSHVQSGIDAVKEHDPAIRNQLLILLNGQDPTALRSREGKEKLRGNILQAVQDVLREETGKPGIEKIYFTAFVMQ